MPYVTEVFLSLDVPPEVAFDALADYPSWKTWMPRSFTPISKSDGPLRPGKRLWIRVVGAPAKIKVTVIDRPKEIAWCGGVRGLFRAEHRFLFESDGKGGARIHSHETFRGALAQLVRGLVKARSQRVASEQLAGLATRVGERGR
jgi:hypothetical protein